MKQYKIISIRNSFDICEGDVVESENEEFAIEDILENLSNELGNYVEIVVKECGGKDEENK